MTDYAVPLKDIRFALRAVAGLDEILSQQAFRDFDAETVDQVLEEAARFAEDVIAPTNTAGDRFGCHVEDGNVVVTEGFADVYRQFVENGWQSLPAPADIGGMGLPEVVGIAASEMWHSANVSFSLCPLLTAGSIVALETHGSEMQKQQFLPKLVTGEWAGTMVLTEPQAGSDLAALATRAVPDGDAYRLTGTKIFITWGDHSMAENIIHLVLARLPDAPPGVRGISMFAVPKYLVNDDGSLGERNDVWAASVEHKMGIHASPTCVLNFGENDGAIGYLVGGENRGLACMFTMMNHARLNVGLQGVSLSERAYQLALGWAKERVQGTAVGKEGRVTIINHPDVRRMLMVMKSQVEAMRAAAYLAGGLIDLESHAADEEQRRRTSARVDLLIPIVKGWLSEVTQEITSLGIQIHGGMGFVEETGAAQFMRDARILPIYEGTTGIQGNDLTGRKLQGDEGRALRRLLDDMRSTAAAVEATDGIEALAAPFRLAVDQAEQAADWLLERAPADPNAAGTASVNFMMLMGTVLGGWMMLCSALAACDAGVDANFADAKRKTAKFYCSHILPRAAAYGSAAMAGPEDVMGLAEELF